MDSRQGLDHDSDPDAAEAGMEVAETVDVALKAAAVAL